MLGDVSRTVPVIRRRRTPCPSPPALARIHIIKTYRRIRRRESFRSEMGERTLNHKRDANKRSIFHLEMIC